ncbi:MAG TPA: helix-turn-helix transcriptional regulator [Gaiellaceae bacterium]|nr:helix-turn-helix transcriptional regulator [Gaiellaceae bacterium]
MAGGPSTTEFSILGLLLSGERSGYDLKKAADAGVGYVWTPARSHVYAVLPRLVEGGYATVRTVAQERRPDKQVYRITTVGKEAFVRWLEEPIDERPGSTDLFLLKVFFGGRMRREALVAHIERRRAYAVEKLAEFRELEQEIRDDETAYHGYLTLRWGLAAGEAWIRWADEILRELAER